MHNPAPLARSIHLPHGFLSALPTFKKAAGGSRRSDTISILTTLLIHCDGTTLGARATNLDVEVTVKCALSDDAMTEPLTVAVPLLALERAVGKAKAVTLTAGDGRVTICADGASVSIPTLPAGDFPQPMRKAFGEVRNVAKLPVDEFLAALASASTASATDPAKGAVLGGVYFEFGEAVPGAADGQLGIGMTGCDGYRLIHTVANAMIATAVEGTSSTAQTSAIVSGDFSTVARALRFGKAKPNPPASVTVFANGYVRLAVGDYTVTAKAVDAEYPAYRKVVPETVKGEDFVVNRSVLKKALTASLRFAPRHAGVELGFEAQRLRIAASSIEKGSYETTVDVMSPRAAAWTTYFNAKLLIDILDIFDGAVVRLAQADPTQPAILTCPNDDRTYAVLMPVRR